MIKCYTLVEYVINRKSPSAIYAAHKAVHKGVRRNNANQNNNNNNNYGKIEVVLFVIKPSSNFSIVNIEII